MKIANWYEIRVGPTENKILTWESEYDASSKAGPAPFIENTR